MMLKQPYSKSLNGSMSLLIVLRHHTKSMTHKRIDRGLSKDGRGIGQGKHFLPPKFIKRTFERWANSTKQLLNTGRGHQTPRKAAHCLRKEVGKNIKLKRAAKEVGTEIRPGKGVQKKKKKEREKEKFPNTRKRSLHWVCGERWNLRGQNTWEEK